MILAPVLPSSQCRKFWDQLSPKQVQILREKLFASELFKGKKASYPQR
jgi:myosin-1